MSLTINMLRPGILNNEAAVFHTSHSDLTLAGVSHSNTLTIYHSILPYMNSPSARIM